MPEDAVEAMKVLNEKLNKISKGLKVHRKRFDRINARLAAIEAGGVGGGGGGAAADYDDEDVVTT